MNKKRRDRLKTAMLYLEKASDIISEAFEQEQDCMDNMPESLQDSERYEVMEQAADNMEDALSSIDDAIAKIENASV